jgi:hypothetical protein
MEDDNLFITTGLLLLSTHNYHWFVIKLHGKKSQSTWCLTIDKIIILLIILVVD